MLQLVHKCCPATTALALQIRGIVAIEGPFEGERPDGPYLCRSNGWSKRGTGRNYSLLSGKDWSTTGWHSNFKAHSDAEAVEIANRRLEKKANKS